MNLTNLRVQKWYFSAAYKPKNFFIGNDTGIISPRSNKILVTTESQNFCFSRVINREVTLKNMNYPFE